MLIMSALLLCSTFVSGKMKWIEGRGLTIYGKSTNIASNDYCRLPITLTYQDEDLSAEGQLTSGLSLRFTTNADTITIRWKIKMMEPVAHLTPCAANSFDLYTSTTGNNWIWVGNTMLQEEDGMTTMVMAEGGRMSDFALYFPLNAKVDSVFIGVNSDAYLMPYRRNDIAPIVLFGSDRAQGFSASRSGLSTSALIERSIGYETINIGLGSVANFDDVMADILVMTHPSCIVIDCNNNMTPRGIIERCIPFIDRLAIVHNNIPIILVEQAIPQATNYNQAELEEIKARNAALNRSYKMLQAAGIKNVHYLPAMQLRSNDWTIDGIHFNDLGLKQYVQRLSEMILKFYPKR